MTTTLKRKQNIFFVADLINYDYRFDNHDFLVFAIDKTDFNSEQIEMGCYWIDFLGRLHTDNVIVKNIKQIGVDIDFDDVDYDLVELANKFKYKKIRKN